MYIVYIWKKFRYQIRQFTIINSNSISISKYYVINKIIQKRDELFWCLKTL
jgi:hypothetical protein